MPWIQNVPLSDVKLGHHYYVDHKTILISIVDPDMAHPEPLYNFNKVHQFKFLDIEHDDECLDESWRFNKQQAREIAKILTDALQSNTNIVVHCVAGICRSGAIAEVGVMLGLS